MTYKPTYPGVFLDPTPPLELGSVTILVAVLGAYHSYSFGPNPTGLDFLETRVGTPLPDWGQMWPRGSGLPGS